MSQNNIQAVLFDLDGVLVDSEPIYEELLHHWLREQSITVDDEFYLALRGGSWRRVFEYLNEKYDTTLDPDSEVQAMSDRIIKYILEAGMPLMDGAKQIVAKLSEIYTLAVVSSSDRKVVNTILAHHGLSKYFSHITSIEDVKYPKPHPQPYAITMAVLGVNPEATVVIEDSVNGVKSGNAAGAFVYALLPVHASASAYGELAKIVYTFDDILKDLE